MYFGFAISLMLHASLLAWAFVNIQSTPPLKTSGPEPVEVAIISPDDLVRLKKGNRRSKQLDAKQSDLLTKGKETKKKTKPKKAPSPPPAAAIPPPEPQADEIAKKLAALQKKQAQEKKLREAALKRAEEAKRKAAEAKKLAAEKKRKEALRKKKLREKRKRLAEKRRKLREMRRRERERKRKAKAKQKKSFDQLANEVFAEDQKALADKDPTRRNRQGGSPDKTDSKKRGPTAGAAEGKDDRLTSSQRAMLGLMMKTATSRCWRINSGLEGIQNIVVKVDVKLKPDGNLAGPPRLVTRGRGALFRDVSNAALRAVVGCAPYDLPKNLYKGGWDYMRVTFDPRRMY